MSFDFTQIKPHKVDVVTTDFRDAQLETCDTWTENTCCDFMETYGELLQGRWSVKLVSKFSRVDLDDVMFKTGIFGCNQSFLQIPACSAANLDSPCPFPLTRVVVPGNKLHEEVRIEGANGTFFKISKMWNMTIITRFSAQTSPSCELLKSPQMFREVHETIQNHRRKAALTQKSLSSLRLPAGVARIVVAYSGYPAPKEAAANNLKSKL